MTFHAVHLGTAASSGWRDVILRDRVGRVQSLTHTVFMAVPPSIWAGSPRTLPSAADTAEGSPSYKVLRATGQRIARSGGPWAVCQRIERGPCAAYETRAIRIRKVLHSRGTSALGVALQSGPSSRIAAFSPALASCSVSSKPGARRAASRRSHLRAERTRRTVSRLGLPNRARQARRGRSARRVPGPARC
jgi:hypothetical protein